MTDTFEQACNRADEKKRAADQARPGWRDTKTAGAATASVASVASVAPAAWPQMDEAAFQGLAGEVVEAIEPHSEADPVALLIQFLTVAGNLVGRTAYYRVEDDRHHANLFAVLVGESAKARKGTSLDAVMGLAPSKG